MKLASWLRTPIAVVGSLAGIGAAIAGLMGAVPVALALGAVATHTVTLLAEFRRKQWTDEERKAHARDTGVTPAPTSQTYDDR